MYLLSLLETQGLILVIQGLFLVFVMEGQFALKYRGRTNLKFQAKFHVYFFKYI